MGSVLIPNPTVTGGVGTVTSVAVSGTDGVEVDSGSPVTSSGTIQLGVNKTTMLTTLNVEDGAQVNDPTTLLDADIGVTVQAHDAVLDSTTASFLTADENKLDGIEALADVTDEVNVAATASVIANTAKVTNVSTNLSIGTTTATALDVNSSDGTNATIPQAIATSAAGLLSGADKAKIDSITGSGGTVLQNVLKLTASVLTTTSQHTIDDTILQSTEVYSPLSTSFTPIKSTSRIYVFVEIPVFTYTVTNTMQVGIFDGAGDCFWSGMANSVGGASYQGYNLMGYQGAGSTSARTYSFGVTSDIAGTLTLNGYNAARKLGGRMYLSMLIVEVG